MFLMTLLILFLYLCSCNNANRCTSCNVDGIKAKVSSLSHCCMGRLVTLSMHLQVLCKARKHNVTGFFYHVWTANWIQTIIIISLTSFIEMF
jgi:hypothetical protein